MALQHKDCRAISVNLELHAHSWVRSKFQHKKNNYFVNKQNKLWQTSRVPKWGSGFRIGKAKVQPRSLDCWKNSPNQEHDKRSAVWVLAHILCSWWDHRQAWTQLGYLQKLSGEFIENFGIICFERRNVSANAEFPWYESYEKKRSQIKPQEQLSGDLRQ